MAVRLEIDASEVVVTLTGLDVLWAWKRRLRIAFPQVGSARAVSRAETRRLRWRLWGSNLPGVLVAGRFWSRGRNEFWCVHSARTLLEVACPSGTPYDLVYLQVDDPESVAARIGAAAGLTSA
ncbi:MAG: hypothetical protein QOE45_2414 [Frankiaceae bacterium]|jgi:hypothetical protein|nr:hypothetical protein [Frankiaceae bacterium]